MSQDNLKLAAQRLQSYGRYGDTELVHLNPIEVDWLRSMSPTGKLTRNPDTGLQEAFLPLIPLAGGALGAMGGSALGIGALAGGALGAGLGSWAESGSLEQGLMTGLGAYALGGLGQAALGGASAAGAAGGMKAGTSALAPEMAAQIAATSGSAAPAALPAAAGGFSAPAAFNPAQLGVSAGSAGFVPTAGAAGGMTAPSTALMSAAPGVGAGASAGLMDKLLSNPQAPMMAAQGLDSMLPTGGGPGGTVGRTMTPEERERSREKERREFIAPVEDMMGAFGPERAYYAYGARGFNVGGPVWGQRLPAGLRINPRAADMSPWGQSFTPGMFMMERNQQSAPPQATPQFPSHRQGRGMGVPLQQPPQDTWRNPNQAVNAPRAVPPSRAVLPAWGTTVEKEKAAEEAARLEQERQSQSQVWRAPTEGFSGLEGYSGYHPLSVSYKKGGPIRRYQQGGLVDAAPQSGITAVVIALQQAYGSREEAVADAARGTGVAGRFGVPPDSPVFDLAFGRRVAGAGDGMSDSIPATIDGEEPVMLTSGEHVIPADAVSHLGNGDTAAGHKFLENLTRRARAARTGTDAQAPEIDPNELV